MTIIRRILIQAVLLVPLLAGSVPAAAPPVDFTMLLSDQECRDVLALDGILYGALAAGGVAVWTEDDPSDFTSWTTRDGLSSNRVNDLHWTGDHLWVATDGGGLTRVTLSETGPEFRQYAGLGDLATLSVQTVVGRVADGSERVFYGLTNGGVGIIIDGFAGNVFSAGSFDGLVSDEIRALTFAGDDLWIGTADGISVYSEGVFHDRSAGLVDRTVHDLILGRDGLDAATEDGVYRWSETAAAWEPLGSDSTGSLDLEEFDGSLWALTDGSGVTDRLRRWNGSVWSAEDVPETGVSRLAASDKLWLCGLARPVSNNLNASWAMIAVRDAQDDWRTWSWDHLLFNEVDGVEITPDGKVWLGSRITAAWSGWDGSSWTQFPELASVENDSLGLFNYGSNLLNLESTSDGTLWITQYFNGGIIRYRPWLDDADHITPDNSALSNKRIVRMLALEDGEMLFLSDRFGADLLLDPDTWADDASWRILPNGASGLNGVVVRDAVQTRSDLVWFTSDDGGLVLWDTNGAAGPDDDLTLADLSDDYWTPSILTLEGSTYDFRSTKGLAAGPDGSLWVAGSGVLHLERINHDDGAVHLKILGSWREKNSPDQPGLLRGTVNDIEIDGNGDAWVCHDAGLDRIRVIDDTSEVDAYTNTSAYESFGLDNVVGTSTICGVAEGNIRELDASSDGRTLVAGGGYGAMLIDIRNASSGSAGPLDRLTVYPNPFRPDVHGEGLRIGGYDSDVTIGSLRVVGGAWVEIYDLEGKLIYRDRHVEQDEPFWTGKNLDMALVATGIYMLRVELDGQVIVKPMAVVR